MSNIGLSGGVVAGFISIGIAAGLYYFITAKILTGGAPFITKARMRSVIRSFFR